MKNNETKVKISTLIGEGAELSGDFSARGSVRIDGTVDGNVDVTGMLILGAMGKINGDVTADSALIGGEVLGNLVVKDKTELAESAKVIGDIATAVIVIDEHAIFQGGCNMNQEVPERKMRGRNAKAVKEGRKTAKTALEEALREVQESEKDAEDSLAAAEKQENTVSWNM